MKVPTDLQILSAIYNRYYKEFAAFDHDHGLRNTKNFVSVDLAQIAADLKVDGDIVFGRLYYHLEQEYGYRKNDGKTKVPFFQFELTQDGKTDRHVVNFPMLASVLADLQEQHRQHQTATIISLISIGFALASLIVSIVSVAYR